MVRAQCPRGAQHVNGPVLRESAYPVLKLRPRYDHRGLGVVEYVREFGIGMAEGKRNGHPAHPPDPPLHGHMVSTRLDQIGHARGWPDGAAVPSAAR